MKRLYIIYVVIVAIILNVIIFQKELILCNGKTILLKLAPRDPRSLMQGDYMVLRYALANNIQKKIKSKNDGVVVLKVNNKGVASFKREYKQGDVINKSEWILKYKKRGRTIRICAESFFFQEGYGEYFQGAKYGELKVSKQGDPVLIGLRNKDIEKIIPKILIKKENQKKIKQKNEILKKPDAK